MQIKSIDLLVSSLFCPSVFGNV